MLNTLRALVRQKRKFARYAAIYDRYRDATMIQRWVYYGNLELAEQTLGRPDLAHAVVECGTWKGGMAAALMEIGGQSRDYMFFDSFEGLPPAKEIDGPAANAWQADKAGPIYHDNCTASEAEFRSVIARAGGPFRLSVYKGFFSDSFPKVSDVPPIALLRLDADWFDSTMECLTKFFDAVMLGGLILIDDYGTWDGCNRAVHKFLADCDRPEAIRRGPGEVAFIEKCAH
jgi:O-methyltransferase